MIEINVERSGELLQRGNASGLMPGLNCRDHGAGDFGHFGKPLLRERAMIAPDPNRALPGEAALGNLKRDQLVFATVKVALGCVVSPYVGKHLRIVRQPLKVLHRDNRELFALKPSCGPIGNRPARRLPIAAPDAIRPHNGRYSTRNAAMGSACAARRAGSAAAASATRVTNTTAHNSIQRLQGFTP